MDIITAVISIVVHGAVVSSAMQMQKIQLAMIPIASLTFGLILIRIIGPSREMGTHPLRL